MSSQPIDNKIRELLDGHQPPSSLVGAPLDSAGEIADPIREVDAELQAWIDQDVQHKTLWHEQQQVDVAIGQSMHEVTVPSGLAEQLKSQMANSNSSAKVELANATTTTTTTTTNTCDATKPNRKSLVKSRTVSKGKWVAAATILLALLVGGTYATTVLLRPKETISRSELGHAAQVWLSEFNESEWREITPEAELEFPISPDVLSRPTRWKKVATSYDPRAYVFDLTPPGKRRILHFTLRVRQETELGTVMPETPIYQTATHCIGASRKGNTVYVLVVEGSIKRYRQAIRRPLPVI